MKTKLRIYDEEKEDFENLLQTFIYACEAKNLSEKTIRWYKQILSQFFEYVGIQKPRLVKPEHIRDYLNHLKTKNIVNNLTKEIYKVGLSSHSIRDNFAAIRAFFNFLEYENHIKSNPIKPLKAPRQENKIINTLTIEQIKKLLSIPDKKTYFSDRDYVIMCTFLDTGIRLNELCNLRINDVNFAENYFIVYGKGKKERVIPFSSKLKRLILKLIEKTDSNTRIIFLLTGMEIR